MKWFPLLVLALGGGYGLYKLNYPTYSWHQKLTLTIGTPDGSATGNAVTEVTHWFHPNFPPDAGIRQSRLRGEAAVVDLGGGRYLFALLDESPKRLKSAFADRLPEFNYGEDGLKRFFRAVERLRGAAAPVPVAALPRLVTFSDIADPTSVMQVDPDDLSAVFGAGYALRAVTLEITDAPVTTGVVEGVLGWLEAVGRSRANLKGKPDQGRVSDQPQPHLYLIAPSDFSTELYK